MKKFLVMTAVAAGLVMFGANQTAQADHQCGSGGGYVYAAPVYSYSVPQYSYAPVYRSAYVQPSYGYGGGYGNTTFLWRHRFLALPNTQKATHLVGIAEADETYFFESF